MGEWEPFVGFCFLERFKGVVPFTFPAGALIFNVLGSFLIGFISLLLFERFFEFASPLRALLLIGVLGGFTTFSTFSLEVVELWENGEGLQVIFYVLLSLILSIAATFGGLTLGRKI